ncbi:ABC transporter ATP-binding protein [Achromobacter xylosoxidans]|uniref:ABC transporter ATP-binding protein n=1 Tax=Alcaligenes xylosoxydans xylosoxydans TaxID=85698 RepID=UPI0008A414B0|nr:ABC transporter ATP-binding protein [Achromobacter xylosoxidans]OFU84696.1 ABC transporter ATP-binding protein [Achromobacter xylosoxidans]
MNKSWEIMRPVRGRIRLAMGLAVAGVLCSLSSLACLALAMRELLLSPDIYPWPAFLGALACTLLACFLRLQAFNQSHYAAFRLEVILRNDLVRHLARLSFGELQALGSGPLAKVVQNDVQALHVFVADSTPLFARAYAMPLFSAALLFALDWRMALAAVGVLAVGVAVLSLAMRGRGAMTRRYHQAREQVSAAVIEYVQAMPVVRTFDTGQSTFGRYHRALERYLAMLTDWYRGASFSSRFAIAALGPLPTLAVLLWLGAWWTAQGQLGFPIWLALLLFGMGMAEAMFPMMSLAHMIDQAKLSVARIQQVLAIAPLAPARAPRRRPVDASVCFEDVRFGYGGHVALDNLSFTAHAGQVTALVGRSGAGKSTVARLIARFWDIDAGRLLVGGVDVRDLERETLFEHVAFVFQDNFLFSGSVAENIAMGRPDARPAEIEAAARAAQAHDFILALPDGYATVLREGGKDLSGGQRQRLTIARAVLMDRPILVLDRGRLAESGTHDTLLAAGGLYAQLWNNHQRARRWTLGEQPS